jgi:hypothetical protein
MTALKENVMRAVTVFILFLTIIVVGFAEIAGAQSQKVLRAPEPAKGVGAEPGAKSTSGPLTGTVVESLDAEPYVYLRLKIPKGETWAAVNKANVKKGSEVTIVNPIPMDGFESKTLKRKFDHIVFGTLAGGGAADSSNFASGHGSPSVTSSQNIAGPHANVSNIPEDAAKIKVKKAGGQAERRWRRSFPRNPRLRTRRLRSAGKLLSTTPGSWARIGFTFVTVRDPVKRGTMTLP